MNTDVGRSSNLTDTAQSDRDPDPLNIAGLSFGAADGVENPTQVTPARINPLSFISYIAHPLLLISVVIYVIAAIGLDWDPGAASLGFLLATVFYLAMLELIIPYERAWLPSRREWGLYAVYFVITMIGGALAQLPVMAVVSMVAPLHPLLPLWAQIPLALLLSSLASYAVHRAGHDIPLLWRLHGVHHVPDKVNVGNNGVNHVFDIVLAQFLVQVSLALIGFSEHAVFAVGIFIIAQGYFVHANIDVRLGWLNHILASPELHRMHHSADKAEAGHFGSDLSIWDRLFGSYTWRPDRKPRAIGLFDPGSFPRNGAIFSTLVHPLRPRKKPAPTPP
ncbi:sterol desaturase family protein [Lysobacter capsici]|uniref:sterol desaturase family protein n=1 Tax=Lysobacter capsici TaxID=435897 RepID=UPI000BBAF440|nr:sterol desaturase family protein [Lysobacter capsici]ATE71460.1 C4-dicarboxylate ABC transporter [Lysobacter capsici]